MQNNSYTMKTTLEIEHVDLARRWNMAAILTAMQTVADLHANLLEAGRDHVLAKGAYWVIARLRVEMERYPQYMDEVSLTTWPGKPDRLTYPRYFNFHDQSGPLGSATSMYMLLDTQTHEIISPAKMDLYSMIDILPDTCARPTKIRPVGEPVKTLHRTPVYSDIDLNRHMNNTRYAQWACDMFPTSKFEESMLRSFQLNYVSDGIEGHDIALTLYEQKDGFVIAGEDTDTGKAVFSSSGTWAAF